MSQHKPPIRKSPLPLIEIGLIAVISLLVWEWLRPSLVLTDTYTVQPFLLFFTFVLLLYWLRLALWIRSILCTAFMLYFIHFLYFYGSLFDSPWLQYVLHDLGQSINLVLQFNFVDHSLMVRTIYFFIFLWTAASYLFTSVIDRGKAFHLVVLTVVFLTTLDTFSPYDAKDAILRTMILSFGLLALNQIKKTITNALFGNRSLNGEQRKKLNAYPLRWLTSGLIVILLFSSIAYLLPKAEPAWPDPVSFLQGYSEYATGGFGSVRKIGYGSHDERLGGPFLMDDGLVFTAETQKLSYWRGESKDVYTGKGWVKSEEIIDPIAREELSGSTKFTGEPLFPLFDENLHLDEITSTIRFEERRYATLFYTGQPHTVYTPGKNYMEVEVLSGQLNVRNEQMKPQRLENYMLDSVSPVFSTNALLNTTFKDTPQHVLTEYTQLPDTLPERVHELAADVVREAQSDYEKVKKIESFLTLGEYEYNIEDVPVPREGQDYVDQFLFESKIGYCDNFSTSMVVMLRTLDIPARWVKGFTFGDVMDRYDGQIITEVRNRHAHSWVEVYFPGIGWVPFEPTRSFLNPYTFERDDIERSDSTEDDFLSYDPLEQESEQDHLSEALERENESRGVTAKDNARFLQPIWITAFMIVFLVIVLVCAYIYRKQLLMVWILRKYRKANPEKAVYTIYEWLIRFLGRFVQKRHGSETMREYVMRLEYSLQQDEWMTFTQLFEELRYGKKQLNEGQSKQAYHVWRSILKKLNL